MKKNFELVLFSTDVSYIQKAVLAGVDTVIVDWELRGKNERQAGADTQINRDTLHDLQRVCQNTTAKKICRINSYNPTTVNEIESATRAGVDEILLPMVRSVDEVFAVLNQVADRCGVGILIETVDAIKIAKQLAQLPLSRIYVGLNDLAIARKTPSIFSAILDGTVERLRQEFTIPFGLAGLTVVDKGYPIPCKLLIGELVRLDCQFSFLRRSFHVDSKNIDLKLVIHDLLNTIQQKNNRSVTTIEFERQELYKAIEFSIQKKEGLIFHDVVN